MSSLILATPLSNTSIRVAICVLVFLAAAVVTNPQLEMGVNDDCSYNHIARDFAATGHIAYNGWAAVPLIPQLLWAGAWIKLFGFSFLVVRISTVLLVVFLIPVLYLLALECGLRPSSAVFTVLLTVLSPFTMPHDVSFMADMPALLFFLLSVYAAVRAWRAASSRGCVLWAVLVFLAGVVSGLERQIYWIAPLTFLPAIAWVQRPRKGAPVWLASIWFATVAAVAFALQWYGAQQYSLKDDIGLGWRTLSAQQLASREALLLAQFAFTLALMLAPLLAGFLAPAWRAVSRRMAACVLISVLALGVAALHWTQLQAPLMGNVITWYGAVPVGVTPYGDSVLVLGLAAREAILMGVTLTCAASLIALWKLAPAWRAFATLAIPPLPAMVFTLLFGAGWAAIVFIRSAGAAASDRYVIPFLPLVAIALLWFLQERVRPSVSPLGWTVLAVFALYGVAITHDAFAGARARLAAADALERRAIPRTSISAGFEYDIWTQLETVGYVNHNLITPHAAYHLTHCLGPAQLTPWYLPLTPAVQPRYIVSLSPLPLPAGPVAPITYTTWLPPARQSVVTHLLPPEFSTTCR